MCCEEAKIYIKKINNKEKAGNDLKEGNFAFGSEIRMLASEKAAGSCY
jgi:hypothetical protein